MKHVSSERTSLAWFKLAEFVTRGEKERALSIYRLLAHSIKSEALAAQLEGDLLQAFQDDRALEAYRRAALLYQREDDTVQAILLYEQISTLDPRQDDILQTLIEWYQRLGDQVRCTEAACRLIALFVQQQRFIEAHDMIVQLMISEEYKAVLHEKFVISLLTTETGKHEERLLKSHIALAMDYFLQRAENNQNAEASCTPFLSVLAGLDKGSHQYACECARNDRMNDMKQAA